MEITVSRKKQRSDGARKYKIIVDGKLIDTIKTGEIKTLEIPDDSKQMWAKVDWCRSQKIPVDMIKDRTIVFRNAFSGWKEKTLIVPLIYISFLKNQYIAFDYANS